MRSTVKLLVVVVLFVVVVLVVVVVVVHLFVVVALGLVVVVEFVVVVVVERWLWRKEQAPLAPSVGLQPSLEVYKQRQRRLLAWVPSVERWC